MGSSFQKLLLETHLPLCEVAARAFHGKRPWSAHDWRELVGDAFIGLREAVAKFDPAVGTAFVPWARRLMVLRMVDGIRETGKLKRGCVKQRERFPLISLQIPVARARYDGHLTLEDTQVSEMPDPSDAPEAQDFWDSIHRCLKTGNPRDGVPWGDVLELYYRAGFNQAEIGALYEVTDSRICQVLRLATARLRERLQVA